VEVSVADNGPGIPAAARGRIFDPFYTTKPVGAGTGIGLAVSRGIAEAHGGSLGLADAPEGGACFVLRLPRAGVRADGTPAEAGSASAAAVPTGPRTALIVDDETELASVLAEMLAALRVRCDLAATGREAQRLLSGRDYDAILCDLRMPDMDGQALFAWMAENRAQLCPRTAFVTGDARARWRRR
jgi:Histidine kinase-, DNA gyrase B-, and HSP90-like ATPase/Response regulator receiver domain